MSEGASERRRLAKPVTDALGVVVPTSVYGLAVAVVLLLLRAPFLAVVAGAALAAALLRLVS